MSLDKNRVTFVDVLDKAGNSHTGPHSTGKSRIPGQSNKASSNFHSQLSKKLQNAKTKSEARKVIGEMHRKHMRVRCKG